jgi:predicted aspartyl protease
MEVDALVDTVSQYLCLPASLVEELGLEANTRRTVTTAAGSSHNCRYIGPIKVRSQDRECYVGALELGDEVLLGAIPREDMDLVVNPHRQTISANPKNPDMPHTLAKGLPPRASNS